MKYDYTVITKSGIEVGGLNWNEAKEAARDMADDEPVIDQCDLASLELTGVYYKLENGNFKKYGGGTRASKMPVQQLQN